MIRSQIVPNVNLFERVQAAKGEMNSMLRMNKMEGVQNSEQGDFKSIFAGMMSNLNTQINEPDNLMKEVASGSSSADIHDVMTAMAKAELGVTIATKATTKLIQTYDKIMQISL